MALESTTLPSALPDGEMLMEQKEQNLMDRLLEEAEE